MTLSAERRSGDGDRTQGMKILFLHGWNSVPGGLKPTFLKDHCHEVVNPALPHEDFAEAVRIAQEEFDRHRPQIVVGSSRGGAMNLQSGEAKAELRIRDAAAFAPIGIVRAELAAVPQPLQNVVGVADGQQPIAAEGPP